MKIDVKVSPFDNPQGSTLAFATVTIDNKFTVRSIRVVSGANGIFTAMPQEKDKDGNYRDIVYFNSKETYSEVNQAVIGAYVVAAQRRNGGKPSLGSAQGKATNTAATEVVYEDPELPY